MTGPIPEMPPEMVASARAAQAAGHPPGPPDDPDELARRAQRYRRGLDWEDIVAMLRDWGAYWETRDATLSPWCDDPDGGELRLWCALREIAEHAARLGPDAAVSTEYLRGVLARWLRRDR